MPSNNLVPSPFAPPNGAPNLDSPTGEPDFEDLSGGAPRFEAPPEPRQIAPDQSAQPDLKPRAVSGNAAPGVLRPNRLRPTEDHRNGDRLNGDRLNGGLGNGAVREVGAARKIGWVRRVLGSMRGRLTLVFALSIALFMVTLGAAMVWYSGRLEGAMLARSLETRAQQYRRDLRDERVQPRTATQWQAFVARENRVPHDSLSMLVLDRAQQVVARTRGGDGPEWPAGGDWLVETVPTKAHTLILAVRWHSTQRAIRDLAFKLGLIGLGVVAATALGSWLLVGRVLLPIERLSGQARLAQSEELQVRLLSPSRDAEVVGLVATLNALLERISQSARSRDRFYAAASHELRTPIQGLSALLEVGLSRPRDAAQWREIAAQALGESQRLGALTQDLLALNQLENQTSAPPRTEIDAADLTLRIAAQLESQIAARRLRVTLDLPDEAEILAPWNHLEMLFRNLIENAVKYAREGGDVRVLLRRQADLVQFSVWNSADLPADFDSQQLFEPFFRLDAARASQVGGNGLGLSIVASLCRANGWSAQIKAENHGLLVLIELPGAIPA